MKSKTKSFLRPLLSILPMLAVMVGIFLFSGQQGEASAGVSNGVGEWLLGILGIGIPPGMSASNVPIIFGLTIRKLAHIFLYFLLGGTSFLFAATLPVKAAAKAKPAISGGIALVISLLYACLDEVHQSFVPGRAAQIQDVGVDAIGFVLAIALCMAASYIVLAVRAKKQENSSKIFSRGIDFLSK